MATRVKIGINAEYALLPSPLTTIPALLRIPRPDRAHVLGAVQGARSGVLQAAARCWWSGAFDARRRRRVLVPGAF